MISEIDTSDMRWFVRKLQSEYEKNSLLKNWCDIQVYFEEDIRPPHQRDFEYWEMSEGNEEEFIQIGEWTNLPISIIQSQTVNDSVISSMVRRITLGERHFLINQLDKLGENDNILMSKAETGIEKIQKLSRQVGGADTLILPHRENSRKLREKISGMEGYSFRNGESIASNGNSIDIHWYSPEKGERLEGHGYLLNSNGVTLTQKWHGDSEAPEGFEHDPDYDKYSMNRPLMLYFGQEVHEDEDEETESLQEKVDFLQRTVVSKPDIEANSVIRLRV